MSFAEKLRGFGPLGIIAFLLVVLGVAVTPPAGALVVVLWVWLSKTSWRGIGYVKPKSWVSAVLVGIAFGVCLKILMKALAMPLLGGPAVSQGFHTMVHNPSAYLEFAVYALIGAGWGEETVFRGYLFERLGKLCGTGVPTKVLAIVVTTAIFGAAHWQQGLFGVEQALMVGLVFGTVFAVTGRLVMLMVAHAAFDLAAAAIVYFDVEPTFAHLVFK